MPDRRTQPPPPQTVAEWIAEAPRLGRLIGAAAIVGALGALTAVAVRVALTEGVAALYGTPDVVTGIASLPAWGRVLAPAAGGVVAGFLVWLLIRRGGPKFADIMEAVALGRGRPKLRAAAAQAAGTVAAVLGGGSLGREGPLINLGASVGDQVARRATRSGREHRALVAAGTAAGFAAAYNTPIAAVLFVLEVIVGVFTLDVIIPVAVAAAIGTALTRIIVGGGPIYGERAFALVSGQEFIAYGALGVAAAIAGFLFMKLLAAGERVFLQLAHWPRAARAGFGGLVVGIIAWQLPEVCGNGYEPVRGILDGELALGALLLLGVAKAIATTASVTSGSPGGVFTPVMLIGATVGGALGHLVARWAPFGAEVLPGGYALVGMAAAVAATTHAPLMATVLVFELTGDYAIVLPLLVATAIATLLARRLQRDSIYTAELRRRGIPWEATVAERLARAARARDLMEADPPIIAGATEPIADALDKLAAGRGRLIYVVDEGPLRAISLSTAKQLWAGCMRGQPLPEGATAGSVASAVPTIGPDDTLLQVGEKLWHVDWGELPVVDPTAPHKPIGIITRRGLLGAFDRELLQRDVLTTRVVSVDEAGARDVGYLELPDGHRFGVIPAPGWLVGHIPDLAALRAKLGVIVVAVRRDAGGNAPPRWYDADARIAVRSGDQLMVIATPAELDRLTRGPSMSQSMPIVTGGSRKPSA